MQRIKTQDEFIEAVNEGKTLWFNDINYISKDKDGSILIRCRYGAFAAGGNELIKSDDDKFVTLIERLSPSVYYVIASIFVKDWVIL